MEEVLLGFCSGIDEEEELKVKDEENDIEFRRIVRKKFVLFIGCKFEEMK